MRLIRKIHRDARDHALRDLIEAYPAAYKLLYDGWVEHFKAERGWTPMERIGRPKGTPRDAHGPGQ